MATSKILEKAQIRKRVISYVIDYIDTLERNQHYSADWKQEMIDNGNEESAQSYDWDIEAAAIVIEHLSKLL